MHFIFNIFTIMAFIFPSISFGMENDSFFFKNTSFPKKNSKSFIDLNPVDDFFIHGNKERKDIPLLKSYCEQKLDFLNSLLKGEEKSPLSSFIQTVKDAIPNQILCRGNDTEALKLMKFLSQSIIEDRDFWERRFNFLNDLEKNQSPKAFESDLSIGIVSKKIEILSKQTSIWGSIINVPSQVVEHYTNFLKKYAKKEEEETTSFKNIKTPEFKSNLFEKTSQVMHNTYVVLSEIKNTLYALDQYHNECLEQFIRLRKYMKAHITFDKNMMSLLDLGKQFKDQSIHILKMGEYDPTINTLEIKAPPVFPEKKFILPLHKAIKTRTPKKLFKSTNTTRHLSLNFNTPIETVSLNNNSINQNEHIEDKEQENK